DSLKERDRFAAEAEAQRKTIAAAIATISEGFVLYDAEDRIVLFNEQFRDIYPGLADIIKPGTTFGQVLETVISRSLVDLAGRARKTGSRSGRRGTSIRAALPNIDTAVALSASASAVFRGAARSPSTPTLRNLDNRTSNSRKQENYRKSPTGLKANS